MNSQISSRNRPALAALLMVLSASTVLAQSNSVPFKGAFDARDTGGAIQGGTVPLTGSGAGTANEPFGLKMAPDPFECTGFCLRLDFLTGQRAIQYP